MQILLGFLIFSGIQLVDAKVFEKALPKVRKEIQEGEIEDAIERLEDLKDKKLSDIEKGKKYFSLGKLYQQQEEWQKSRDSLAKALGFHRDKEAYAHYLRGHAFKKEGQVKKAQKEFRKAVDLKPPRNIVRDARFELAEIAIEEGKAKKAYSHLKYLERRWRGSFRHPDIVWRLIGVELKRKRKWRACRWARKMFSRYAGHSLAKDWGADLPSNQYGGEALGCLSSTKDIKRRIKRLQLYGQSDRARKELDWLKENRGQDEKYDIDIMRAEYLNWQGYPDEALNVLIQHYEDRESDFDYLKLLGKVAAKATQYNTAVGAYYKAFQTKPRTKKGREALFSAAFLSYQFQDYDGASRKFKELRRRFRSSGLARDSKWHLAWIRYLKRDFKGAESDFKALLKDTYRRRRRRYRPFNNDRTRYWLAMSHLRQNELQEAKDLFVKIADNGAYTYYSILARTRLQTTPGLQLFRELASKKSGAPDLALNDFLLLPNPGLADIPTPLKSGNDPEADESEDTLDPMAENDDDTDSDDEAESEEESAKDEIVATSFKDPKLQARFDRANEFIELGFAGWAKWELYEIERRTRNKTYLRLLMEAYNKIGSYNRSVHISTVFFAKDRARGGFEAARDLWQWNFPKAFDEQVSKSTSRHSVNPALVFGIMRAESNFRKEAISPVGARGLMQIMPYTAEQIAKLLDDDDYEEARLSDVNTNIEYGTRYLARLQKKFQNLIPLSAAGYNAGPHRVYSWLNNFGNLDMDEFIEHIPFVETRNYVKKVLRHYFVYSHLYKIESKQSLAWLSRPIPVRVNSRPSPRENWEKLD